MGSSSLIRDQTQALALGPWGLSHGSTREVPATSLTLDLLWDAVLCERLCWNHMATELRMLTGDLSWSRSYLLTALLCLSLVFSSSRMYTAFWWCWTNNQLAFIPSLHWGELKDLGLRAKVNSQRKSISWDQSKASWMATSVLGGEAHPNKKAGRGGTGEPGCGSDLALKSGSATCRLWQHEPAIILKWWWQSPSCGLIWSGRALIALVNTCRESS